jgi:hypothetical protein
MKTATRTKVRSPKRKVRKRLKHPRDEFCLFPLAGEAGSGIM